MSDNPWHALVKRYCPEDRQVCNCGRAWATYFPAMTDGATDIIDSDNRGILRVRSVGAWQCADGCQRAQAVTQDEVAIRVLKDLG